MKKRHIALAALAVVGIGAGTAAYVATPAVHEGSPGETPELGQFGEYSVGSQELAFAMPDRVTFGRLGLATGATETETRELMVRIYYPADVAAGAAPINYSHTMEPPDMEPVTFDYAGRAFADAPALGAEENGDKFPLVIMSHGFNGWSTQFSNLAEHIASHGYVVASIDHADMKLEGTVDFIHSFTKVLASRSLDQRQILAQLLGRAGYFCIAEPADCPDPIGYGVGWGLFGEPGRTVLNHGGNDFAEHAQVYFIPETREGLVLFVNGGNAFPAGIEIILAVDPELRMAKHFDALIKKMREQGGE